MPDTLPVLIVGAGPTGLTMALELNRYGIPFRIIDKQVKPVVHSNALAVQTRTLYAWEDMGLLSEALSRGQKIKGLNLYSNAKKLARIDLDLLEGNMHFVLGLAQHETENMMIERLRGKNILVEMEVSVTDIQENDSNIRVILQHKDGRQEELNPQWLIACDGGNSFVREKLGISFVGKQLTQHFVLADAEVQSDLTKNEGYVFISDGGIFLFLPFDKKYSRIIAEVSRDPILNKAKSITYEQVKQLSEKLCPIQLHISEPVWTSGFWIHENIIANYRHKRIFFAGDAAHLHSPAGGQGMNTGIQDVYNLAWKLAYVLQGKLNGVLLDTYQAERHQVGKNVLRNTTFLTNAITTHNFILKNIRDFIIYHFAKINFIQKKIVNTVSELSITYSNSLLVKDCMPWQSGPKAGTFKADIPPRLDALLNGNSFVLLLFSARAKQAQVFVDFINTFKYAHLVKCVFISEDISAWSETSCIDENLEIHKIFGVAKPSVYLIRPDKYIGFRGKLKHKKELENYFASFVSH